MSIVPNSNSIPKTMKGVRLPGDRVCELVDYDVGRPGPGEVLIQMRASTICGSDLRAIYRPKAEDRETGAEAYTGCVAGHEPCGMVILRGEGVAEEWKEGTPVAIYHIQGCGSCHNCRKGLYIYCTGWENRAAYGWQRNGGHAEYLLASVQSLVHLPEPLTYLDGAILGCGLGTAYGACLRAQLSGQDNLLVTALGPVGLGVALLAQKFGATVLGTDPDPWRVEFAEKLGIKGIVCAKPDEGGMEEDVRRIVEWSGGEGPDVAIDCSGTGSARLTCLKAVRPWARVVFVGEGGELNVEVSPIIIHKSLAIYGSWVCSITELEDLVKMLVKWDLHPEVTITDVFTLDEAKKAYEIYDAGKTGKCAIVFQGEKKRYNEVSASK